MGQWIWVNPKHTIKEYFEISNEEYRAKTGKPYTVQEAVDRYGTARFRTKQQRRNFIKDQKPKREAYAEKELDKILNSVCEEYSADKETGKADPLSRYSAYVRFALFDCALEVCPQATLFLTEGLEGGGWRDRHSPQTAAILLDLAYKAIACGYASDTDSALSWAKDHR